MLILLFNIGGYRIVIPLIQDKADHKLETLLDNSEYDEAQLIEIRVTMNMPYQQRFTEYERHYGEIEIDGIAYTYVKRKIEGDVVIFKCIANEARQQFKSLQNDLAKANSNTDMDQPGQQKQQTSFAKNFWSEYDDQLMLWSDVALTSSLNKLFHNYSFTLPSPSVTTPHQPPEAVMVLS